MYDFRIILPPQTRFQTISYNEEPLDGFSLYDRNRRPIAILSTDKAKKILYKKTNHKYSALEQFIFDFRKTFGFKAFRTTYGWRTKEVLPNGTEYIQQLHFSNFDKPSKKIDKIKFPSGNIYTLILAEAENGDFIAIRQKNKGKPYGYTVSAKDRKFANSFLLKRIEQFALKIGQNPDGSEKPYMRKIGGLIFSLARKCKIKGGF